MRKRRIFRRHCWDPQVWAVARVGDEQRGPTEPTPCEGYMGKVCTDHSHADPILPMDVNSSAKSHSGPYS